ncbi:MAG: GGDEF domain-containing protein [Gammaproteobacteria bacterium]|nr:GGDEF domain-containing protein [Gammaproteobacteria bacterium]
MPLSALNVANTAVIQHNSIIAVALVTVVFLTPFTIYNLFADKYILGLGSILIMGLLGFKAWTIRRGHYHPYLTLFGTVPIIMLVLVFSIMKQGTIGAQWAYPAIISFYFMLDEKKAWLANAVLIVIIFPLMWSTIPHDVASRLIATQIIVSMFSAIFIRIITNQQHVLQLKAVTDPLTGVYNRVMLHDILKNIVNKNRRQRVPMTMLTIDIDHFKAINDVYGHDTGDKVLNGIAELLQKRIRSTDMVFRLGGEEFLTILYGTNHDDGLHIAEELREAIASARFIPKYPITVSMGVAALVSGENYEDWMKRSDVNLYRAKRAGRNQVAS